MAALGYDGELKANQPYEVAEKMKWLVASLYTFSAIVMFVSITFIYNLSKKKVAIMTEELNARRNAEKKATEEIHQEAETVETEETLESVEETVEETYEN